MVNRSCPQGTVQAIDFLSNSTKRHTARRHWGPQRSIYRCACDGMDDRPAAVVIFITRNICFKSIYNTDSEIGTWFTRPVFP